MFRKFPFESGLLSFDPIIGGVFSFSCIFSILCVFAIIDFGCNVLFFCVLCVFKPSEIQKITSDSYIVPFFLIFSNEVCFCTAFCWCLIFCLC